MPLRAISNGHIPLLAQIYILALCVPSVFGQVHSRKIADESLQNPLRSIIERTNLAEISGKGCIASIISEDGTPQTEFSMKVGQTRDVNVGRAELSISLLTISPTDGLAVLTFNGSRSNFYFSPIKQPTPSPSATAIMATVTPTAIEATVTPLDAMAQSVYNFNSSEGTDTKRQTAENAPGRYTQRNVELKDSGGVAGIVWLMVGGMVIAVILRRQGFAFSLPSLGIPVRGHRGYVYVMTHKLFRGQVKIGMTTRSVEERAKELSRTAHTTEFKVRYKASFVNPKRAERAIHRRLDNYRVAKGREFFKVSVGRARREIKALQRKVHRPWWKFF